ncbi:hypothetical protein CRG98_048688, partial [Punica granatum]
MHGRRAACAGYGQARGVRGARAGARACAGVRERARACAFSSGPALRAFGSLGLGVSTFPWGR